MSKKSTFDPAAFVKDVSEKKIKQATILLRRDTLKNMARAIEKRVNLEIGRILKNIAEHIIGQPSFGAQTYRLTPNVISSTDRTNLDVRLSSQDFKRFQISIKNPAFANETLAVWRPLTGRTIKEKGARGSTNPAGFFEDSGALKRYFENVDSLAKFGACTVTVTNPVTAAQVGGASGLRRIAGRLHIQFLPRIASYLEAISQKQFSSTAGVEFRLFGPTYGKKLRGHDRAKYSTSLNRPLVQPVLYYYMTYRIPRAIAIGVNSVNVRRNRKALSTSPFEV